jgi:hypothetical protein
MTLSTKSPTLHGKGSSHTAVRATATGVDNNGQLFREQVSIVYLKMQKCVFRSKANPPTDGSLMIEIVGSSGKDSWRSDAKVKHVSPVEPNRDGFHVTIELDRAHSLEINALEAEAPAQAETPEGSETDGLPSFVVQDSSAQGSVLDLSSIPPAGEKAETKVTGRGGPAAVPAPKMMIADIVRSVTASEFAQLRRELQSGLSSLVEGAVREPVQALEQKMEQRLRSPTVTEETVRKVATQVVEKEAVAAAEQAAKKKLEQHFAAHPIVSEDGVERIAVKVAEKIQADWAATKLPKIVAEIVRETLGAARDERRREITTLISSHVDAAVDGPIAETIESMIEKALKAQWAEHARKPPPVTDETIRLIAARVAEHPQLQGAIDSLAATLSERWATIAHSASVGVQQDIQTRIAASERLASEVAADIQSKLSAFGAEMAQIFEGRQSGGLLSPKDRAKKAELANQEKKFMDLLQNAGSQFEDEMKAALQRVFGKR